jgi:hypothetical protein
MGENTRYILQNRRSGPIYSTPDVRSPRFPQSPDGEIPGAPFDTAAVIAWMRTVICSASDFRHRNVKLRSLSCPLSQDNIRAQYSRSRLLDDCAFSNSLSDRRDERKIGKTKGSCDRLLRADLSQSEGENRSSTGSFRVSDFRRMLSEVIELTQMSQAYSAFAERHNIRSAPNLTVIEDETAELICERLSPRIAGKTVVEIGGGIGILSLAMASVARRVYCIEANPRWAAIWTEILVEKKPKNMNYLFGAADEFVGCIRGDVAVICTHSDVQGLKLVGRQFASQVVDVYGELIEENPAAFDALASRLRAGS